MVHKHEELLLGSPSRGRKHVWQPLAREVGDELSQILGGAVDCTRSLSEAVAHERDGAITLDGGVVERAERLRVGEPAHLGAAGRPRHALTAVWRAEGVWLSHAPAPMQDLTHCPTVIECHAILVACRARVRCVGELLLVDKRAR